MAKLQVSDVALVSSNGKQIRKVSMLILEDGHNLVLSNKLPKKAAVNFALSLITKKLQLALNKPNGKRNSKLGRPRKHKVAE